MSNSTKWNEYKTVLLDGLTPKQAKWMDICVENTRKEYTRRQQILTENASSSAVSTGNVATLTKVVLPLQRRVLPNTMAQDLVGFQPMPGPVAQVVTLRYIYGNSSAGAGVISGEEMLAPLHVRDIAAAFTGNENAAVPAGASDRGSGLVATTPFQPW